MIVATEIKSKLTLEEFLQLPETKPECEFFNGEVEQKIMPQGEHSIIQFRLGKAIDENISSKKIAMVFPELRCTFSGQSIVPDLSVFEWHRLPKTETGKIANKFEISPDWIIEILSPEQYSNKVIKKILFCLKQGTKLGWLIDPEDESVMIFKPDQLPEIKSNDEVLPLLECIPDWQLSAGEIFSWLKIE
jgi:Uma2 family endonuclease